MVDIKQSNIVAGGVGWIDVEIYATAGSHEISFAGYEFEIVPISGSGSLEFLGTQETNELENHRYLFFELGPTSNFTTDAIGPTEYIGGDYTDDSDDSDPDPNVTTYETVTVGIDRRLLVRLDVQHVSPSLAAGATFSINMISGTFQDGSGNEIAFDVATNSLPGIATITAVPEPSSLLMLVGTGVGWLTLRRRRRS